MCYDRNKKGECNMDITKVNQNFSIAIKEVDNSGMVIIDKHNKPSYVIMTHSFYENLAKYFENLSGVLKTKEEKNMTFDSEMTLHDAMITILKNADDKTMRYNELATKIFEQGLYFKRDGTKAKSSQILLRARNYQHLFEVVGKHFIKLI
jgi:hypothetical protein